MSSNVRFRYFLASRPGPASLCVLAPLRDATGQGGRRIKAEHLHLTWFVIAETEQRDPFILPRVEAAMTGMSLASGYLWLGRVRGGSKGAAVHSRGGKPDILRLYRDLAARMRERGLPPLHRASGFDPHVTLGYDSCTFPPFTILHEWIPDSIMLIESEVGRRTHNVLASWPLPSPRQGFLPFSSHEPERLRHIGSRHGHGS